VKLNKYQTVYEIINAVCNQRDIEELKQYIADSDTQPQDNDTAAYLVACKEALSVYEQGFFRRWSTAFLQTKVDECRQPHNDRYAGIYEAEIQSRKA